MNWLDLIASVVSSLAWPVVVVVTLLVLKEPIERAIPRLHKLKYKELEAEFDRELVRIEKEAKEAGFENIQDDEVIEDFQENLKQISRISPNAAIVEAFREIERSAKKLLEVKGVTPDYKVAAPYRLIERVLEKTKTLGTRELKIFRDLRQLRNKITHSEFTATEGQAIEYIELAAQLIAKMEAEISVFAAPIK
jgi:hypothetical protein